MIPTEHRNVGKPIDIKIYEDTLSVNTKSNPVRDKKKGRINAAKATRYLWDLRKAIAENRRK